MVVWWKSEGTTKPSQGNLIETWRLLLMNLVISLNEIFNESCIDLQDCCFHEFAEQHNQNLTILSRVPSTPPSYVARIASTIPFHYPCFKPQQIPRDKWGLKSKMAHVIMSHKPHALSKIFNFVGPHFSTLIHKRLLGLFKQE